MKWLKVLHENQPRYGLLNEQENSIALTNHGWSEILAGKPPKITNTIPAEKARLLNPIGRPAKIVCVGLNYLDHCRETNTEPPEQPLLFTKFTTAVVGPNDNIVWSTSHTQQVDFEAELAVIIGKKGRHIDEATALSYVAGYTAANDVSARDIQFGDGQWVRGKSLDTFCPLGPTFVTADDIPNPQALAIRSTLNDQVMQDSHTSLMIFSVAQIIAFCAASFTLEPGDVILTGTPHGVGLGQTPPLFMQDGDRIVVEVEKIGRLENVCRPVT